MAIDRLLSNVNQRSTCHWPQLLSEHPCGLLASRWKSLFSCLGDQWLLKSRQSESRLLGWWFRWGYDVYRTCFGQTIKWPQTMYACVRVLYVRMQVPICKSNTFDFIRFVHMVVCLKAKNFVFGPIRGTFIYIEAQLKPKSMAEFQHNCDQQGKICRIHGACTGQPKFNKAHSRSQPFWVEQNH